MEHIFIDGRHEDSDLAFPSVVKVWILFNPSQQSAAAIPFKNDPAHRIVCFFSETSAKDHYDLVDEESRAGLVAMQIDRAQLLEVCGRSDISFAYYASNATVEMYDAGGTIGPIIPQPTKN